MTSKEVVDYLKIHRNTLNNWVRDKDITVFRVGKRRLRRFLRSEVEQIMKERK